MVIRDGQWHLRPDFIPIIFGVRWWWWWMMCTGVINLWPPRKTSRDIVFIGQESSFVSNISPMIIIIMRWSIASVCNDECRWMQYNKRENKAFFENENERTIVVVMMKNNTWAENNHAVGQTDWSYLVWFVCCGVTHSDIIILNQTKQCLSYNTTFWYAHCLQIYWTKRNELGRICK